MATQGQTNQGLEGVKSGLSVPVRIWSSSYSCKRAHTLEHGGSANTPYARFTEYAAEQTSFIASTSGGCAFKSFRLALSAHTRANADKYR
jgi:hypothetical protein